MGKQEVCQLGLGRGEGQNAPASKTRGVHVHGSPTYIPFVDTKGDRGGSGRPHCPRKCGQSINFFAGEFCFQAGC